MIPIVNPETSVSNHLTLSNNPEYGRILLFNRGGILRSYILHILKTIEAVSIFTQFNEVIPQKTVAAINFIAPLPQTQFREQEDI
jgi:hypothetical protein